MLKINYFASIRERLNKSHEDIELPDSVQTVAELMAFLGKQNEQVYQVLCGNANVLVSVNKTIVGRNCALGSGDEIAFFPPMTGG